MIKEISTPIGLYRKEKFTTEQSYFKSHLVIGYSKTKIYLNDYLSKQEHESLKEFKHSKRQYEYLIGRYVAKKSILPFLPNHTPKDITIKKGIFGQPIVSSVINYDNYQLSLTHTSNFAASLSYPEFHPMGIDLEVINPKNDKILNRVLTYKEKLLIEKISSNESEALSIIWTVKESISKVLRTGLTVPLDLLAIKNVKQEEFQYICEFENFPQYKAVTWIFSPFILTICLPKNTIIQLEDRKKIKQFFSLK
ncbi:4'-phosphopantetheinyl transferase family protein [Shouchella hunanensis]|uniref:4'-phosphopantetheinyl transferase superfamily protein n=1 Tax=Shouchella hunanensis TaxID=766894 RepID=A0ABY7W357_9BACI|nr:4'-phosphopantetheinyl transferase family protein [Shouchella hunanensis]WDF02024.1 4'-phosphopantetheinyl transferase superfamily protein [Shouchella hunanensis]